MSVFILLKIINFYFEENMIQSAFTNILIETNLKSAEIKNKINNLFLPSIVKMDLKIKGSISEYIIYQSKKTKYSYQSKNYAKDIFKSNKLIEEDKVKFINNKSNLQFKKEKFKDLDEFISKKSKFFKSKENKIVKFFNISNILNKPTLLITYSYKNFYITKIILSDYFNGESYIMPFKEFMICDFDGNILYHSNKAKTILKDNIKNEPFFKGLENTKFDQRAIRVNYEGNGIFSSAEFLRDLQLIFILNVKEEFYMEEIYNIKRRNLILVILNFLVYEVILYIFLRKFLTNINYKK